MSEAIGKIQESTILHTAEICVKSFGFLKKFTVTLTGHTATYFDLSTHGDKHSLVYSNV